jgi:hypothetical protein
VVDVVGEAHRHAAVAGALEGVADDLFRRVVQANVVQRDVEAVLGCVDELGDGLRDFRRGLPAVRQRADVDRGRLQELCARSLAL